ncbi:HAE1 family hydrophobic/amphiphilic exporter-1 [Caldicoprobacter guelmensis]|uniref:efflux RND transporter permease subunit n=1 Tax=Caldicoprobacter guelmensis TaxID=1170224 RepID=UPI0019578056|nr:efflux RND transporter permease subunit [Caldicoprobacter guelmensis]MBM7582246.1 HAE1 family hydrophobic/amphiphilic exporter-1 [Caldicoprobacter guelmensis]
MSIAGLSVRRPVTTVMVVLIVLILGFVSLTRLNVDLLPSINLPIMVVSVQYSGAGPEEVESIVTRNIESVLATVGNLESMRSTSSEGNSLVILEFTQGTNMDVAALEVREKLDMIRGMLPEGVSDPIVLKLDPNMLPIMSFAVSQEGKTDEELQEWVEDVLKPRIERIEGVASVSVLGAKQTEIKVIVDPDKLIAYGLTMDRIVSALRAENLALPGGVVQDGQYDLLVRISGQFESLDELLNVPVVSSTGITYMLRDLARVERGVKDDRQYSRVNQYDSLSISVYKESVANTVRVAEKVNQEIENIKKAYPDITVMNIIDQSKFINRSISAVTSNAYIGAILAIAILFIFLKDVTPTLVIATSIPISVISTFVLLYFSGITLNIISLGGLALGVGMMVDNSIVALENIYRMREKGLNPSEAAEKGTNEISMAIMASTLTTVSVFLPIVFTQGMTAEIFRELSLTVTFSLMASLVVAITLVPMLASKLIRGKGFSRKNKAVERLTERYRHMLQWALEHRKAVMFITAVVFGLSIVLLPLVGVEYFPAVDQGQIQIEIRLPKGSSFDETLEAVQKVEKIVDEIPEVDMVWAVIGGQRMSFGMGAPVRDQGSITAILKPLDQRSRTTQQVGEEIREKVKDIAGCQIQVNTDSGLVGLGSGMTGSPISISIKGQDLHVLQEISDDIVKIVSSVPGTRQVRSSFEEGRPELRIIVDRQRASQYGVNAALVSTAVQSHLQGMVATRYKEQGTEIDVRVQLPADGNMKLQDVENVMVMSPLGIAVPLKSVARFEYAQGPARIERQDQSRVVTVNGSYEGRSFGEVMRDIQEKLKDYPLPEGYFIEYGGQQEQLSEAFGDLRLVLVLGVLLVYMIMASQFESLVHPFTVMFTVPLAFTGGLIGLLIAGKPLSVPAFLGFIMLVGIVVNNGIVLVDYINRIRKDYAELKQAIVQAGTIRLRPVLMTSLTTILGLLPLALGLGESSELQVPLAVTVMGGLTLSTFLTLVIVPVVYSLVDDLGRWIGKRLRMV